MSKILVKLMSNIYEAGDFLSGWKTCLLYMIYKSKGTCETLLMIGDFCGFQCCERCIQEY
jgi:hypothetical protein